MPEELQKKILVVDDDPIIAELLQAGLPEYHVEVVPDAESALGAAEILQPDLFIVDLILPGMRGTSLALILHDSPDFSETPVFLLSGLIEPVTEDGEPVRVNGLTGFSKPFKMSILEKHIHLHLSDPVNAQSTLQQLQPGRIAGD